MGVFSGHHGGSAVEPFATDSRLFLENKPFGKLRFSQETADFRRKPQIFAGNRRFSQEPAENRRLTFVPLGLSP